MSDDIIPALPSKSEAVEFTSNMRDAFDNFGDAAAEALSFLRKSQEVDYWRGYEGDYDSWAEWYNTELEDQLAFLKDVKIQIDVRAGLVQTLDAGGVPKTDIAETLGISRRSVYRVLDVSGSSVPDGTRSSSDDDVSAGQSVESVGHIDEHSVPSPFVSDDEPSVVKMSQAFYEPNKDEEPAEEVDRFAGINFDALILPTSNQIVQADPTPDTPDYFVPRTVAPSWSPPQVAELPPPVAKRYDDDQPEFLAQPMKLEKPRDPNKSDEKHCRTCACMLLP